MCHCKNHITLSEESTNDGWNVSNLHHGSVAEASARELKIKREFELNGISSDLKGMNPK